MAYVVKRPRGSWEIRESVTTEAGPRARTLATFRELTAEVVEKALGRTRTGVSEKEVLDAALRAGARPAASASDDAAARLLAQLAQGRMPSPALRRLLREALNKDRPPESARWVGASLEERGKALHDLLLLTDRLPPKKRKLQTVARLDSRSGMKEPSLPDKVIAVHGALKRKKVGHAFGGALALAYYAEPRATIDIDLKLFLSPKEHERVEAALALVKVSAEMNPVKLERDGQIRIWWGRTPIDLFFSYDEIHEAMKNKTRRVPFGDDTIPILAPEHLVVCKVIFTRPQDWIDIEQVVAMVPQLNIDEIRDWLARVAGASASSSKRFESLVRRVLKD